MWAQSSGTGRSSVIPTKGYVISSTDTVGALGLRGCSTERHPHPLPNPGTLKAAGCT